MPISLFLTARREWTCRACGELIPYLNFYYQDERAIAEDQGAPEQVEFDAVGAGRTCSLASSVLLDAFECQQTWHPDRC